VTLTYDLQNERSSKGRQVATTYQVWSKYLQLFICEVQTYIHTNWRQWTPFSTLCMGNINNDNTRNNVYNTVISIKSLREFTQFIWYI